MDAAFAITAFVTLFVVIDPIGLAPIFAILTRGMAPAERRAVAVRASLVAVGILTLFGVLGEAVLDFVGISMAAFRISGGILLFLTAFDMLFERRTQRREGQAADHSPDPSVFPMATPLIAGPGALASMILLAGESGGSLPALIGVHLVMFVVVGLVFVLCLGAGLLERVLGHTGVNVVTRLMGMLLAALSVQFVLDGLADFGFVTGG